MLFNSETIQHYYSGTKKLFIFKLSGIVEVKILFNFTEST